MKTLAMAASLAGCCAWVCPGYSESQVPETVVRIGILEKLNAFTFGCDGTFEVFDLRNGERKLFQSAQGIAADSSGQNIRLGGSQWGPLIRIHSRSGALRVNGRRYRNTLLVKAVSGARITAINELAVDEYVYGILTREVSPDWPAEALKAQAVISRTFALRNAARHGSDGYGLCSKAHCQVYGGMESEDPRANAAVDATHNEVLTHDDDLANTLFFANCGGRTESPANAWESNGSLSYLKSVRCKYCSQSKHFNWTRACSSEEVCRAVSQLDAGSPIRSIAVAGRASSGRARFIKIRQKAGAVSVRASQFRMAMGPEVIRSTYIKEIKKIPGGSFLFRGRGWGHGVGLCQDGARGQAERGASYRKILRFYYPGTILRRFED